MIRFFLFSFTTLGLILLLNTGWNFSGTQVPPLGKFMSPFTGFWQNAEDKDPSLLININPALLIDEVTVKIDSQRVPHIFAKNDYDLYYTQGYITARDRLWQMEFISMAASGRLSEIFGKKALEYDRTMRRIGIPRAAATAIKMLESDSVAQLILKAYTNGVNSYIVSLTTDKLPFEYKLLDYQPQLWTPLNSALLLKYMANMLTGKDYDLEYTNALKFLDPETFNLLFPDFPKGIDPVIPAGTPFQKLITIDSSAIPKSNPAVTTKLNYSSFEKPEPNLGSNNWAVSPAKSSSGYPLLCNDPHLKLQLPPIWYQIQLHAPGVNVSGVSIPGAPGITIGYNSHIAWGVTNGSMDVKDWYSIRFKDASKSEYLLDGQWMLSERVIEEIKVRGAETFLDTVTYTVHGPVTYDDKFSYNNSKEYLALRWTAHDPSNELKTFYLLNRAKNHEDFLAALNHYECPGQNFVFASNEGDIAIKQQGKFVLRETGEGKFVRDGSDSRARWKGFIPFNDNPHVKNPDRGFVSSANQHPTDSTYPYYYSGRYEYYRNRRINQILASKNAFTIDDMKKLQTDNYNMMASEALPYLLTMINPAGLEEEEQKAFLDLASWNFYNEPNLTAPTYFTTMWNILYQSIWDEFLPEKEKGLEAPDYFNTIAFMTQYPDHELMDLQETTPKETLQDLIPKAFSEAVSQLRHWQDSTRKSLEWASYKATTLAHYIPGIKPLNVLNLPIGGDNHIVNATSSTHGASWRMIVELSHPVKAWGIYPGGQSGNPGSRHYSDFALDWANGSYYELVFLENQDQEHDKIIFSQTLRKE